MSIKTVRNFVLVVSVLVLTFGTGYRLGRNEISPGLISGSEVNSGKNVSGKPVDLTLFWNVWDRLGRYYIDRTALDTQKMVYGAISGMVSSLGDPYTVFLPPDQNKEAKEDLGGKFEGIGAQLGIKDKKIIVIAPLKGSPAEISGLKAGDWILKVDNKDTSGWTLPEAVSHIRGPKGSKVLLSILGKESSKSADVSVSRDTIKVASVEWELKKVNCNGNDSPESDCQKIVYFRLARFGDETNQDWNKAVDEIEGAINLVENKNISGIVFDLRNNPGGYLSGSVFIASEFLKDGTVVIQESANGIKQNFNVNRAGRLREIPMVVLINKGTASAGEIVAGALKERKRAKLVGETTFGKGTIQEAQELNGGAGVHITIAKWLLPSGKWINGSGIDPDVKIENNDSKPDDDLQLNSAAQLLAK
jgi:carboxyl-terminal processing protease